MKIAVQDAMLPGDTAAERIRYARSLGIDGIEFHSDDIRGNIPDLQVTLADNGLVASAVNVGRVHLIHPDYEARDGAIAAIRQAMTDALDLGAEGVVFAPHRPDTPRLPDLHPYKSSEELEAELLFKQLKTTLCDLAYAIGAELYIAATNRYETHLVRKLEHAATVLKQSNDHPHLKIAANLFHMSMEEENLTEALAAHATRLGYVQVADSNHLLPGQGLIDFAAVGRTLKAGGYDGWLTLACDHPSYNAKTHAADLMAAIAVLRVQFQ